MSKNIEKFYLKYNFFFYKKNIKLKEYMEDANNLNYKEDDFYSFLEDKIKEAFYKDYFIKNIIYYINRPEYKEHSCNYVNFYFNKPELDEENDYSFNIVFKKFEKETHILKKLISLFYKYILEVLKKYLIDFTFYSMNIGKEKYKSIYVLEVNFLDNFKKSENLNIDNANLDFLLLDD